MTSRTVPIAARVATLLFIAAVFPSARAHAAEGDGYPMINGLYPLWENTADVHDAWNGQGGFAHAQLGLPGGLQIGTQPVFDFYGTWNGEAKIALFSGQRLRLALGAAYFRVPTAAESRRVGNLTATTLNNPYGAITLLPVTLPVTLRLAPWLRAHVSPTVLTEWDQATGTRSTSFGAAAMLEFRAGENRSVILHAGTEGVGVATQHHVGMSVAYRSRHVELRLGLARRLADGEWATQILFDGAVLFR